MNIRQSLTNFLHLASGEVISKVFGFFTTIYLARILGTERFGEYSWVMAVFSYLYMLSNFGIETYGTRAIAQGASHGLISSLLMLRSIYSAVLLAVLVLLFLFIPEFSALLLLQSFSLVLLPLNMQYVFRGLHRSRYDGASRGFQSLLFMMMVFGVVQPEQNGTLPVLWFIASALCSLIFLRIMVHLTGFVFTIPSFMELRRMFRETLPVGIASVLTLIYLNLDTVLLGIMTDHTSVGYYSAAFKIYYLGYSLLSLYYMAYLPSLSMRNAAGYHRSLMSYLALLCSASVLIAVIASTLPEWIVEVLYAGRYRESAEVLRILFFALSLSCINFAFMNPLQAAGKNRVFIMLLGIRTVIFFLLCLLLIPGKGIYGAASATLFAESVSVLLSGVFFIQHLRNESPA
jgi:O-antigen/teichoic acid export membrane protein